MALEDPQRPTENRAPPRTTGSEKLVPNSLEESKSNQNYSILSQLLGTFLLTYFILVPKLRVQLSEAILLPGARALPSS